MNMFTGSSELLRGWFLVSVIYSKSLTVIIAPWWQTAKKHLQRHYYMATLIAETHPWIQSGRWRRCGPCRQSWWTSACRSSSPHPQSGHTWGGSSGRWWGAGTPSACGDRWRDEEPRRKIILGQIKLLGLTFLHEWNKIIYLPLATIHPLP